MTRTLTTSTVPSDYAELFNHYYPYVKALVLKYKVPRDIHEDVAMTLLTKFIEKDLLDEFDPERVGVNGQPVQFSSFLSGFIVAYVRYYAERAAKDGMRYPTYVNQGERLATDGGVELPWLDLHGFKHEDDTAAVEYDLMVAKIKAHLSTIEVRKKKNFALLFDLMLDQLELDGRLHKRELARHFDVSEPLMASWIKQLANHIRPLYS